MDIILLRHAKAEDRLPELDDAERVLTPEGRKQARDVSKGLALYLRKAGQYRNLVKPSPTCDANRGDYCQNTGQHQGKGMPCHIQRPFLTS